MAYFNRTEMRSLRLATGLLLLGAAARLGFGPRPDDFSWVETAESTARERSSLPATLSRVSEGVAEEEAAAVPLRPGERIDPNAAPEAQLRRLPGVGPSRARAIIAARESGGPFLAPDDLLRVPGIGSRTLEVLRPHLDLQASPASAGRPIRRNSSRVNVNQAQIKELEQITGIGPTLAARIVASRRAMGPFAGPEDLLRVPGIGPAVLHRIGPQVRF